MDHSKTALYKNSLYVATGIFVFLMFAATTSSAHMDQVKSNAIATTTTPEIATLGRFVVTPSAAHFVATPPAAHRQHRLNAATRGAL